MTKSCLIDFIAYIIQKRKKIMMHRILQPRHIFIRVKGFLFMLVPGGLQLHIISTCFASKGHVLHVTARERVNCNINARLVFINKRQFRVARVFMP